MTKFLLGCLVGATVLALMAGSALAITTTGWTEYGSNPVYAPAGRAYYPTILKEGSTFTMWTDNGAGNLDVAASTDGISWTSIGTASGLTTPKHSLVEKIGTDYRIWYWPNLSYSINDMRTATSADGINWANDQALTQVGTSVIGAGMCWNRGSYGPADVIYNPSGSVDITAPTDEASVWANRFVMYYDGTTGGDEALGLAVSNDGMNWQGYNNGVAPVFAGTYSGNPDWDEDYATRATVIKESDDLYHMWYSGGHGRMNEGIGYASSVDGINWTRDAANPIFYITDGPAWRSDRTYTPMVIGDEMWFTGKSGAGAYTIGYATGAAAPIPEPISLIFFGTGLIAVLGYLKRRTLLR